jgi:hypothetical protein
MPRSTALYWSTREIILLPPSPIPGSVAPASTMPSPSPLPRFGFALCANSNGDLYLFGGGRISAARDYDSQNDLYLYSTAENTATLIETSGDIPSPRYRPASAMYGSDLIVWGGRSGTAEHDDNLYMLDLSA